MTMSQTLSASLKTSEATAKADVVLQQVSKSFEGEIAIRGVDLSVKQGEFFSILGPSGCGKTTTLRLVAGFEEPTTGEVLIQGQNVNRVPAYRRPVNTVFQSYALFNHLSVWENIAFGLRIKGCGKRQVQERVAEALQLVKMESFAQRFPKQLSGGQRQRVALARALVNRPAVMLLDEPLGALDLKLRKQMQVELSNLHRELGITFILVTHDQEEALSLSDRIAVMRDGEIEQVGSPSEIYESPRTPFVADFIGDTNLIAGRVEEVEPAALRVKTAAGLKVLARRLESNQDFKTSQSIYVSVRPEKIRLSLEAPTTHKVNCFAGRLKHIMYLGTHLHFVVELATGDCVTVLRPNRVEQLPDQHAQVYAYWSPKDCLALAA
ncbi:MAG: ABC transporter ATP-binding protein [Cyanobacteria bacterium J06635_15]